MKRSFFVLIFFGVVRVVQAQEQVFLEQVVLLALKKNYDIQLADNSRSTATTNDKYAWGAFLPQFNATGSTTTNSSDQSIKFKDSSKNAKGTNESTNLSAGIQVNWLLFDGTKMFAIRERIAVTAEQSELQLKDQMVNTIASIISNYYNIVRQKQQLNATREQMGVSEERVKLAERKLQVGTGAKPELLQAKVDLNSQRTLVIQQEALVMQLKETLNGLVGEQLPQVYDVADTIEIDLGLQLEDIQNNVENSNYSLLASRRNLNIASLSLRERRAELLPVLNFAGGYNYSKIDNSKLINPFGSIFLQNNGYNYGLSLTVPILNGLNTRRLIQQAEITADRQRLLYEQQKINVNVNIRNAYINYDNAKKVLLIEEENILVAKENVSIALEGFKRGNSTFVELRTAQQSLADAYNRLINARYLAKVAETELLRLNGGLLKQTD